MEYRRQCVSPGLYRVLSIFRLLPGIDLSEDLVHDTSGKDDFAVRDWRWTARSDAVVKALNELLHSKVLVKPLPNEIGDVDACVPKVLAGNSKRRHEIRQITLAGSILVSNNGPADVIDDD